MKIREIFKRAVAYTLAAVTALSAFPASRVLAAGSIGTISFDHTYDGAGNAMRYNSTANIDGHVPGNTGEYIVLFGCAVSLFGGGSDSNAYTPVSAEVQAYTPLIQKYAKQHGIPEYVELIKAVMMQESGGRGNDPMQAAECGYNTRYPNTPNGIPDPEYSVDVGIQNIAACLNAAGVKNPLDMENIKLALQGYNFGNGYITWAKANYGGYSYANALEFSVMQAEKHGWSGYGDTQYVAHVLLYYPYGRAFTGGGNQAIVEVALT